MCNFQMYPPFKWKRSQRWSVAVKDELKWGKRWYAHKEMFVNVTTCWRCSTLCLYHLQNRDTDLQLWHREIRRKTDSRGVIWSFGKQPCVQQKSLDCSGNIDNNAGVPWKKVSCTEKFLSALSRNTITQWGAVNYMDYNLLQILFICCR